MSKVDDYWKNLQQKIKYKKNCAFTLSSKIYGDNELEGKNFLDKHSVLDNSRLGYASYIGRNTTLIKTFVGKYTCIGPNVSIISGKHPTKEFVSVHPAFYSLRKQSGFTYVREQKFCEETYADAEKTWYVTIGNDVWIGDGVKIMSGVHISDGAVIAAGAVVTKNVAAYDIVGGVPARHIGFRFEGTDREFLINFKWWNKSFEWVRSHSEYFNSISKLRDIIERDGDYEE